VAVTSGPVIQNSIGMELALIPAGTFCMGSHNGNSDEAPAHLVTIKNSFYMGIYEVTQGQWKQVIGAPASALRHGSSQGMHGEGDRYPLYYASWSFAQEFIRKLNALNDGYVYRLPTEAEWEYACRAGTTVDTMHELDSRAWDADNSRQQTQPVGTKRPNAFGLYDMQGNVSEWCWDRYHPNYESAPVDGSAWLGGGEENERVLRGGSWNATAADQSSSKRNHLAAGNGLNSHTGFRVVALKADTATSAVTASKSVLKRGEIVENELKIAFVQIPDGSFLMGSDSGGPNERPAHQVTIKKSFYMSLSEVLNEEWDKVMRGHGQSRHGDYGKPVENVSWDDAQTFIKTLNERQGAFNYRLPTEAEWEYACRAGTTGNYAGVLDDMAWYGVTQTHQAGSKEPNAFGLYDMHGNVWEWCQDVYHETYAGAPSDGSPWLTGGQQGYRVLRGGSWYDRPLLLRSTSRQGVAAGDRTNGYGFRIVATKRSRVLQFLQKQNP
jgi:formylglycine-generating enzyme required for sulfatase activity